MNISELMAFSEADVTAVRNAIAPKAPDEIIRLILFRCRQLGADPMGRMIYAINRPRKKEGAVRPKCPKCGKNLRKSKDEGWYCWKQTEGCGLNVSDDHPVVAGVGELTEDNWVLQCSIDLARAQAESSTGYAGQDGPYWCGRDGVWRDVWIAEDVGGKPQWPHAARVGILRASFLQTLWATAHMREYGSTDGLWPTRGASQLAKCAEMLGLRRAFPEKLKGLYIPEEFRDSEEFEDDETVTQTALNVAPLALPPGLKSAAEVLGIMPRGIQSDLDKVGGDVAVLEAQYVERVAKKTEHARPVVIETPLTPTDQEHKAFLDEHAEKPPLRQAVRGLAIEFGRPAAKAMFPTRESRLAFTMQVIKRNITSTNDLFDEEIIIVGDALRDRIATEGPAVQGVTCGACGAHPGTTHFSNCEMAAA